MDAQQIDRMERLIVAIQENTASTNEMITLLKKERQPWIGPEEAARLLGLPITTSRSHRRRLARAVKAGMLVKIRDGRPPAYFREEILEFAKKIERGDVYI